MSRELMNIIDEMVTELKELERAEELLKEKINMIKDDIKNELESEGVETLETGRYLIRWTSVISSRFDTKRFKEELGADLYKAYCKEITSRRFTIG